MTIDERLMRVALDLARGGLGAVEPNPLVGCVIVRDGTVIGKGFHQRFGGDHAEIVALRSLDSLADARGATAYVSLEPCCHHGKTPPCTTALIDAGIARVVIAMTDPFPKVAGGGLRQLREAGIKTVQGVLEQEAKQLNAPYLKTVGTGKPWVIAKWAMTIDGRIATTAGQSQWITGELSRGNVHQLRARVDAVIVGMGTVDSDDPLLTARLPSNQPPARVAKRVVFCRHRLPSSNARLLTTLDTAPLLLIVGPGTDRDAVACRAAAGATVIDTQTDDPVDMVQVALSKLGQLNMTNVLVEGGAELLASFFAAGQIDECHVYLGAKAFGGQAAPGPIGGTGIERIADAMSFRLLEVDRLDDDLRAVYRREMD